MGVNLSKKKQLRPLHSRSSTTNTSSSGYDNSSILTGNDSFASSREDLEIEVESILPFERSYYERDLAWKEQHLLSKETWGAHFLAPVNEWLKQGIKVLDMG
jgi:hypothetical protein